MYESEKLARLFALAKRANECGFISVNELSKPLTRKVVVEFPAPSTPEERDLFFKKIHTPYGL